MKLYFIPLILGNVLLAAAFGAEPSPEARAARTRAYQLYEQKQFERSAEEFRKYLAESPEDSSVAIDYANLLAQLNRHADAARVLEAVRANQPQNEPAYFRLGVAYVTLSRLDDAEKVFAALEKSTNRDMAAAARDALSRLRDALGREARFKGEEAIYKLAGESRHEEVVREIWKLEQAGALSHEMEMQRLYSLTALKRYAEALEAAERLDRQRPGNADLTLLRADLYNRLGRRAEAQAVWAAIQRDHRGTKAAAEAGRRLTEQEAPATPEDRIYALARQKKHREVVEAIDDLERKGPLASAMEMQRLYAWLSLGEAKLALDRFELIWPQLPQTPQLFLLHADLLLGEHRWQEASAVLQQLQVDHAETTFAVQAQDRLAAIPEVANVEKWYWGEANLSGDYLGRFGTVVGSGFLRHGYYIPHARWLQPYATMRFSADTRSGGGQRGTIITDNFMAFSGGLRAQLLSTEYLFIYAEGGMNKDFLDQRENGDWAFDYQAGLYGFKSWGPGTTLRTPSQIVQTGGRVPAAQVDADAARESSQASDASWRGDWFADAGGDFSYYDRYSSWLGYGQARQGFRLFQLGPAAAVDAYAVENVGWDVRGNFYDNYFEIGPGLRLLWVPRKRWEVVLRTEWFFGFYTGRDELNNRGGTPTSYDGVHIGLSVGIRW